MTCLERRERRFRNGGLITRLSTDENELIFDDLLLPDVAHDMFSCWLHRETTSEVLSMALAKLLVANLS